MPARRVLRGIFHRAFFLALALSLAAHLLLLQLPGLVAHIQAPVPPLTASLTALDRLRLADPAPLSSPPAEFPAAPPPAASAEPAEPAIQPEPAPEPAPQPPEPPPQLPPAPQPALRAAARAAPGGLALRYAVEVGGEHFIAGRATYRWQTGGGRYRLESAIEATGVVALFVPGRIVQRSEGWLDGSGLRPEHYRLTRGQRAPQRAHFDWPAQRLQLGTGAHPLMPQAQDLLSFPFHLALTARADEGDFDLWVTDGRRFRDYRFRMLGETVLELGERRLATLHLRGERPGTPALDVWLLPERGGVPVKVGTLDDQGRRLTLVLEDLHEFAPEFAPEFDPANDPETDPETRPETAPAPPPVLVPPPAPVSAPVAAPPQTGDSGQPDPT